MRFLSFITVFVAAGPALAHGVHIETIAGHDHGLGVAMFVGIGAGLLAWRLFRERRPASSDD